MSRNIAVCVAAVSTFFVFDVVWALIRGSVLDAGYTLAVLGLGLAAAVATGGLVGALRGGARLSLAALSVLDAALARDPAASALPTLVFFALASTVIAAFPLRGFSPWVLGGSVGVAMGFRARLWPAVADVFGPFALPTGLSAALFFALALGCMALACRAFRELGWSLRLASLVPVAALVAALGVAAVFESVRSTARVALEETAPPVSRRPNIILLVLDTVRADHLGVYGYERETTPELSRFVRESDRAVVYPFAFATSSWTLPSHASLFTGALPSVHGVHYGAQEDLRRSALIRWQLDAEETLAERLRGAGFRTAGFVANPYLLRVEGLGRGFDAWFQPARVRRLGSTGESVRRRLLPEYHAEVDKPTPSAQRVNDALLTFLGGCQQGGCFAFANYMEAHTPLTPRRPFAGAFSGGASPRGRLRIGSDPGEVAWNRDCYDEELLGLDAALGSLLEALARSGTLDRSWLVITSDHGESFSEHGVVGHGSSVYNEQVLIPLVIQPPVGVALQPSTQPISLVDLTATLAAIGSDAPLGHGRDLRQPAPGPGAAPIEFFGRDEPGDVARVGALVREPARAVVRGPYKLIEHMGRRELYRLDEDRPEALDLASEQPRLVAELSDALPPGLSREARRSTEQGDPLDAEAARELRALGYLP